MHFQKVILYLNANLWLVPRNLGKCNNIDAFFLFFILRTQIDRLLRIKAPVYAILPYVP